MSDQQTNALNDLENRWIAFKKLSEHASVLGKQIEEMKAHEVNNPTQTITRV